MWASFIEAKLSALHLTTKLAYFAAFLSDSPRSLSSARNRNILTTPQRSYRSRADTLSTFRTDTEQSFLSSRTCSAVVLAKFSPMRFRSAWPPASSTRRLIERDLLLTFAERWHYRLATAIIVTAQLTVRYFSYLPCPAIYDLPRRVPLLNLLRMRRRYFLTQRCSLKLAQVQLTRFSFRLAVYCKLHISLRLFIIPDLSHSVIRQVLQRVSPTAIILPSNFTTTAVSFSFPPFAEKAPVLCYLTDFQIPSDSAAIVLFIP